MSRRTHYARMQQLQETGPIPFDGTASTASNVESYQFGGAFVNFRLFLHRLWAQRETVSAVSFLSLEYARGTPISVELLK